MSEAQYFPRVLCSFDELRSAVSHNPPADYLWGVAARISFLAELGRICESAKRQNMPEHPNHPAYMRSAARNRAHVITMGKRDDQMAKDSQTMQRRRYDAEQERIADEMERLGMKRAA
jgi:hypothetical protein